MNMIVGKRQIVLAALVLCLSIAVYLNWQYSDVNHDLLLTNKTEEVKNYGDAQYVENIDEGQSAAFFAEA